MKFNIKEWQNKQLNEVKGLNDLKDAYYEIGDELTDMAANIEAVRNHPEGMAWETSKLGKGGLQNKDEKSFEWQKRNLKAALDPDPIDPTMYKGA